MQEDSPRARELENHLALQVEAYHDAALLYAAAKLNLSEIMGRNSWTADDLAGALNLSPPHLFRFLRALTNLGLCEERPDQSFALTQLGREFRPGSASRLYEKVTIVVEQYWQPWANLLHSLETGQPAFDHVFGTDVWSWRRTNAAQGALFDAYYAPQSARQAEAIIESVSFEAARSVADIGGGSGALLGSILGACPHLSGILLDQPQTAARAEALLQGNELSGRAELVAGDFFDAVPHGADIYILKHVLHDWDDAECIAILRNCRAAMREDAKLLVIESLAPDDARDDPAAIMLDMHMMIVLGGKERRLDEYRALLAQAGLAISAVTPTSCGLSILEAAVA